MLAWKWEEWVKWSKRGENFKWISRTKLPDELAIGNKCINRTIASFLSHGDHFGVEVQVILPPRSHAPPYPSQSLSLSQGRICHCKHHRREIRVKAICNSKWLVFMAFGELQQQVEVVESTRFPPFIGPLVLLQIHRMWSCSVSP